MGNHSSRSLKPTSWWDSNLCDFDAVEALLRKDLELFFDSPNQTCAPSPALVLRTPRKGVSVVKGGSIVVPPDPNPEGPYFPKFYGKLLYDTRHSEYHTFDHLVDSFSDESVAKKCKAWLRNTSKDREIEVSEGKGEFLANRRILSCFPGGNLCLLSLHRTYKSKSEAWVFDFSVDYKKEGKLPSDAWRSFVIREAIRIKRVSEYETEVSIVSYLSGMDPRLHHLPDLGCFCHIADLKLVDPGIEFFPLKGDVKRCIGLPTQDQVETNPIADVQLWQIGQIDSYPLQAIRQTGYEPISVSRRAFYLQFPNYGMVRPRLYLPYFDR